MKIWENKIELNNWNKIIFLLAACILPFSHSFIISTLAILAILVSVAFDLQQTNPRLIYIIFGFIIFQYYLLKSSINLSTSTVIFGIGLFTFGILYSRHLCLVRNKGQIKNSVKAIPSVPEINVFMWPLIATLLYTVPELLTSNTKKLALQFDGYDNVVHYGIFSKIISCESFVSKCPQAPLSPLDDYPQSWHSFFANFSLNYDHAPSQILALFVLFKAASLFLSFLLLNFSMIAIEKQRGSNSTKFGLLSKSLVFIGPLPIYYFSGWPNYTLSIALLIFSYAAFVSRKQGLALLSLSVSALVYSLFWPLVLIIGLIIFRDKIKIHFIFVYIGLLFIPASTFFWQAYNSKLNEYLSISNSLAPWTLFQLFTLVILLFSLWKRRSNENRFLRFYVSSILIIGIPYQIISLVDGNGGAYFLQKFLGPAPFLIYIGILGFLGDKTRKFEYLREVKMVLYPIFILIVTYWSTPILVSQSARSLVPNERLITGLNSYQYGAKASPINSAIRNYYVAFDSTSGYALFRIERARFVLKEYELNQGSLIYFSRTGDASFYHNSQWLNALNNSWSNDVQSIIDEASKSNLKDVELASFLESKEISLETTENDFSK